MSKVFVNYRTDDGDFAAALLDVLLGDVFGTGEIFLDNRSILPGADFEHEILTRLSGSVVLFAVIGRRWFDGRRIDRPDDWVRRELIEARRLGITVVPVLLDTTQRLVDNDLPDELRWLAKAQFIRFRHRHARADARDVIEKVRDVLTVTAKDLRAYLTALSERLQVTGDWLPYSALDDGFVERRVNVHRQPPTRPDVLPEGEVGWHNASHALKLGVVLADAGFGKTWLLRHHGLRLCHTVLGQLDAGVPLDEIAVPVLVHARELAVHWGQGKPCAAVAAAALDGVRELAGNVRLRNFLEERLSPAAGPIHVLVDAYDEVFDDVLRDSVAEALKWLSSLMGRQSGPSLVLTSRPAGFVDPFLSLRENDEDDDLPRPVYFELGVLGEHQVRRLWTRWFTLRSGPVPWQHLDPALTPDSAIRTAAGIPLIAAFCAWVAETQQVTTSRSGLYGQVVDRFYSLGWKQGAPSPFAALRQDPALRGRYRRAIAAVAWHMAVSQEDWQDAITVDECESVMEGEIGGADAARSRTFDATRAFGILVAWGVDDSAPIGWIHRSVHQFVVAGQLITKPVAEIESLVGERGWFRPVWADVLDFALGLEAGGAGSHRVTTVVQRLCLDGGDGLGWFATVFTAAAAGTPADESRRTVIDLVWRLYHAGFLSASHLARVLALTQESDPAQVAEIVSGTIDDRDHHREAWQALAWCGEAGIRLLRKAIAERANATGAASALFRIAPDQAVEVMRERLRRGLPVSSQDRLVLRDLDQSDVAAQCAAYRQNPGSLSLARTLGWTATSLARDELKAALDDPDPDHRRAAVAGLAAGFATELDHPGFDILLAIARHDPDGRVRVLARDELAAIGNSVPWVDELLDVHFLDLYRDDTVPELTDLDSLATRIREVGPATITAVTMLQEAPDLLTGPVRDAMAELVDRALHGDLDAALIEQIVIYGRDEFASLVHRYITSTTDLPIQNVRNLVIGLSLARPHDPLVFEAVVTCAGRTLDPRIAHALRAHELNPSDKARSLLTRLAAKDLTRATVEVWSSALWDILVQLPTSSQIRDQCATVTTARLSS